MDIQENAVAKTVDKQHQGFKKGQSGNPAGRKAGSRNKASLIVEKLMAEDIEDITKNLVMMAKNGDMTAIKIVIDKLIPNKKSGQISFELPTIKTATDIAGGFSQILEQVSTGEISVADAKDVGSILESARKTYEIEELEKRIDELQLKLGVK